MDISSWTEMESIYTNDDAFVNHCQMMTQFDELPFSSCTYSNQPSHHQPAFSSSCKETHQKSTSFSSSSCNISISFSNSDSISATNTSKKYLDNLSMTSVKTEVPSSETTINFSLDSHRDFEDGQRLIQPLGYGNNGDSNQKKMSYSRSGLQAQDHALAERNRRERLTQGFIALSALIPNLKKLDKASVLGDAIMYIKQLEEQVRILEENATKYTEESTVVAKRARSNGEYSSSFGSENSNISTGQSFPEIEVRASNENVLIKIYCKKQISGIIKEIFSQVEKLNLSITNSSVMPFGCNTIHIKIVAQMDQELSKKAEEDDANRICVAMMKLINGQEEAA